MFSAQHASNNNPHSNRKSHHHQGELIVHNLQGFSPTQLRSTDGGCSGTAKQLYEQSRISYNNTTIQQVQDGDSIVLIPDQAIESTLLSGGTVTNGGNCGVGPIFFTPH